MVVRRISNDELYHHGVKGQQWGTRRYQNPDGSLTPEGRARYGYKFEKMSRYNRKELLNSSETNARIERSKEFKRMGKKIKKESDPITKEERSRMHKLYEQTKDRVATDEEWNEYFKANRSLELKKQIIRKKYIDEYASIYIKELGMEDTKAGRECVKKFLLKEHNKNTKAVTFGVTAYGPVGKRKMPVGIKD